MPTLQTFGPCITCPSLIYGFSLPLLESSNFWPLNHLSLSDLHLLITPFGILIFQTFGPCITCPSLIYTLSLPPLVSSYFWPLYHLSLSNLHPLITPLVSSYFWPLYHLSLSNLHPLITPFGIFKRFLIDLLFSIYFKMLHHYFHNFKTL